MADMPTWEEAKAASKPAIAKEAPPASTEEVSTDVKASEPEEPKAQNKPEEKAEAKLDYQAELERYKQRLEETERVSEKRLKALERISKAKESKPEESDEDTSESVADGLEQIIERKTIERLEKFQREQASDVIDDVLGDLSDDENEKALVKALYENGEVKATGYTRKAIEADLKKAFLLANAPRLESIALEKAQAKVRKSTAEEKAILQSSSASGAIGREPPQVSTNPALNEKEQKWMQYLEQKQKRY